MTRRLLHSPGHGRAHPGADRALRRRRGCPPARQPPARAAGRARAPAGAHRLGAAPDRRPLGRRAAGDGREDRPDRRLGAAQGPAAGRARDAAAGLRARRRARAPWTCSAASACCARAREQLAAGDAAAAAAALGEALALWRGPALAGFDEPFARPEAARLEELHLACLEERIAADLALGRAADLIGELEALVARNPLRERLREQQMLALYRSGRQAEALGAYQAARRVLDEELGLEPSASLRELERRMLQQDPSLETPAQAVTWRPPSAAPGARRAPAGRAADPTASGSPARWPRRWPARRPSCCWVARRVRASRRSASRSRWRPPPPARSSGAASASSSTARPRRTCPSSTRLPGPRARPAETRWWPRSRSARRPGSRSCPGWPRGRPARTCRRTCWAPRASACCARSSRRCTRSPRRARSCSCSRTCSGATPRRSTCSVRSRGGANRPACSSSARSAPPTLRRASTSSTAWRPTSR